METMGEGECRDAHSGGIELSSHVQNLYCVSTYLELAVHVNAVVEMLKKVRKRIDRADHMALRLLRGITKRLTCVIEGQERNPS